MFAKDRAGGIRSFDQRLFDNLIYATVIMLVLDTIMWSLNGAEFRFSRELNILTAAFYYAATPYIGFSYLLYCDYKVFGSERKLRRRIWAYALPLAANVLMAIASFWTKWYFDVDGENLYHAGGLFVLSAIFTFLYLIYAVVISLRKAVSTQGKNERREYIYISLFMVPPMLGVLIQTFFLDISIVWVCVVVALLILFINVQNYQISTDSLTGINNRRRLHKYLEVKLKSAQVPGMRIYAVMIDIDDFKKINDTFGHSVGDAALVTVATILKNVCCGSDDFIARLGGDEFALICKRHDESEICCTIAEIQAGVDDFNSNDCRYLLSLSMGYAVFGKENTMTPEALLAEADKMMYAEKSAKKLNPVLRRDRP